ncbi:MAG: XRE family transcriptional regulator [Agathobacter sp.]|nr:XRE family transcriptional regulator [Agathobacter sp.]MDY3796894.1 XRE family transcriptional regulator [Agathobacter sp.]
MGKRSTKENKNIYQLYREEAALTREKASEKMEYISADRIEKIESEKSYPHPDEILVMADCYKKPNLCNYYCSHECPIGKEFVPEVRLKDLSQIVLEMLASLNAIDKDKNRLIEITADGKLTADEYRDFASIENQLNKISLSADALKLWLQQTIMDGKIDKEELDKARNEI